ncbi:uncharacterized protein At5g41620-like [Humulus lupulus]|uniref:uncharacterized protein At5g41620-like n=1 Tax=Humulus lupulus TaxID=3486 RepID=UPI002B4126E9|nr:uncharacterized protein At5g41620-like [Humulus lupulus]
MALVGFWVRIKISVFLFSSHFRNENGFLMTHPDPHLAWPCSRQSLSRRTNRSSSRRRRARTAPSTPLIPWNFRTFVSTTLRPRSPLPEAVVRLSARKLAAGLWHLHFKELSFGPSTDNSLFTPPTHDRRSRPLIESSLPYPNCVSKKKTNGSYDICSKASNGVYYIFSHQKTDHKQQSTSLSITSALQAEVSHCRSRIRELEAKKLSLKTKVKHLLNKLQGERIPWQRVDQDKNCAVLGDLASELVKERKSRQRMEILNAKLVKQLAEIKLSTEQLIGDYEEEKRNRELVEEVCDKLAQRIGEDKAEVEKLKMEYVKVREELEEERKMLQLAEVWREERVQMKLVDAKIALEDKFEMMNTLILEFESFLRSACGSLNEMELREAERILKAAVRSLSIQDQMEEFSYVPPKSNDIYSIMEELQECYAKEEKVGPSNSLNGSTMASHEINGCDKNLVLLYSNCLSDYNSVFDEGTTRACASVSCTKDQCSCHSPESSNSSLKSANHTNNDILRNRIESNEDGGKLSPTSSEISQVSVSTKKSKRSSSSVSKILRSAQIYKTVSSDEGDQRVSNGTMSCMKTCSSPVRGKLRHRAQWISAKLANPHITRGMKGCIEWPQPQAIQNNVVKAKLPLSEARIESQKSQLRHFLKPKN